MRLGILLEGVTFLSSQGADWICERMCWGCMEHRSTVLISLTDSITLSVTGLPRWTVPHHSWGWKQEKWTRGPTGSPTHPSLEWRQSVPVIPAQAGRPPCGHAASVCEEGEAVQSSSVGADRWKWLETHPDHIMGHRPWECKSKNKDVKEVYSWNLNYFSCFWQ